MLNRMNTTKYEVSRSRDLQSVESEFKNSKSLTQFEKLSRRVDSATISARSRRKNNDYVTSIEEDIYESIVKNISSANPPRLNSLVKKTSGLLKLSQMQELEQDLQEVKQKQVKTSNYYVRNNHGREEGKLSNPDPVEDLQFDDFSAHFRRNENEILSKLLLNGGNFSEIWDEFQGVLGVVTSGTNTSCTTSRKDSRSSVATNKSTDTRRSNQGRPRPEWKYFAGHKTLSSATSSTSVGSSSVLSKKSKIIVDDFIKPPSTVSSRGSVNTRPPKSSGNLRCPRIVTKKVYVIRGQLITLQGMDHAFRNWFGDEALLKGCKGDYRKDVDLRRFKNCEITLNLRDDIKLIIEAYRAARGGMPPLRHKSMINLPEFVSLDQLICCRARDGRLILQSL